MKSLLAGPYNSAPIEGVSPRRKAQLLHPLTASSAQQILHNDSVVPVRHSIRPGNYLDALMARQAAKPAARMLREFLGIATLQFVVEPALFSAASMAVRAASSNRSSYWLRRSEEFPVSINSFQTDRDVLALHAGKIDRSTDATRYRYQLLVDRAADRRLQTVFAGWSGCARRDNHYSLPLCTSGSSASSRAGFRRAAVSTSFMTTADCSADHSSVGTGFQKVSQHDFQLLIVGSASHSSRRSRRNAIRFSSAPPLQSDCLQHEEIDLLLPSATTWMTNHFAREENVFSPYRLPRRGTPHRKSSHIQLY